MFGITTMAKPINDLSFWRDRIETAVRPQYSVYVAHDALWNRILDDHLAIILEHIKPNESVLDAGCGYGRMSQYLDNYTGVDFSPDFISLAKKNYPGEVFIQANLKQLPGKTGQFDWALVISIKKMVEDNLGTDEWLQILQELKRVAKGVLILEYEDSKNYEIIDNR